MAAERSLKKDRIQSLDLLRGAIMILMTLDHTRDFFHLNNYGPDGSWVSPTDVSATTPFLFFTRWITHYCAPGFIFLAGTSAFLAGRRRTKKQLSIFLLTRGLWLILLEFTVINFAWRFDYHFIGMGVIWGIGACMVLMAALVYLPWKIILAFGIVVVCGHNLLDGFTTTPDDGASHIIWSLLHQKPAQPFMLAAPVIESGEVISQGFYMKLIYPIIPWIGVMALGFCFGKMFEPGFSKERRLELLWMIGLGATILFVALRFINGYGDPNPFEIQPRGAIYTFLDFLNVNKYPPSLHYLLMTIGPSMFILYFIEAAKINLRPVNIVGRVPFFFYLIHLYVIHGMALLSAKIEGKDLDWNNWGGLPTGHGYSLWGTYAWTLLILIILYIPCFFYNRYKTAHPENKFLSYI